MEAQWAEWLDEYDIIWTYEVQGFDLNGTWYLPDFYLPEINTIIEVKGIMERIEKPYKLMKNLEKKHGWGFDEDELPSYCPDDSLMVLLAGPVPYLYNVDSWYSEGFYIHLCPKCGKNSIITMLGDYSCRVCGAHVGGSAGNYNGLELLAKPIEWLCLEE